MDRTPDPVPLLHAAGVELPDGADVRLVGVDPVLSCRHPVGEAAAAAVGAAGAWAARVGEVRGLPPQTVTVDVTAAATSLLGFVFQTLDGPLEVSRTFSPVTDVFRTSDGRMVHLHGGLPHLAEGTTDLLGCRAETGDLARAVSTWTADDLEDALADAGLCGAIVRSASEWAAHPHGRLLVERPAIRLTRIDSDGPDGPGPLSGPGERGRQSGSESAGGRDASAAVRPLDGVRILDLTRILAGPTIGRTLAGHGADVLRVDSPTLPTVEAFDVDTGHGKRRAWCDLDVPEDRDALLRLVDGADVVVCGYRPGAFEARGLGPADLIARRPGLIVVQVSCYGTGGPWATRRGWEQLAQATSGLAHAENPEDPQLVPAAVTDYTTGYLGAAGAAVALAQRATEGGSWIVEVSLCATAAWLVRLGAVLDPVTASGLGDVSARQQQTPTERGLLTHLAPVERLSHTPVRWDLPPCPSGVHLLEWPTNAG